MGFLVLVSAACLTAQVVLTDYGDSGARSGVFWFAVGCWLLWLVHARHNRVARILLASSGIVGTAVYAVRAVTDPHAALLALLFLGEVLPLLAPPVTAHVRPKPKDPEAAT